MRTISFTPPSMDSPGKILDHIMTAISLCEVKMKAHQPDINSTFSELKESVKGILNGDLDFSEVN